MPRTRNEAKKTLNEECTKKKDELKKVQEELDKSKGKEKEGKKNDLKQQEKDLENRIKALEYASEKLDQLVDNQPKLLEQQNENFQELMKRLDKLQGESKLGSIEAISIADVQEKAEKTHAILTKYIESYKEERTVDRWMKGGEIFLGVVGLAMGIAGLILAVQARDNTEPDENQGDNSRHDSNDADAGIIPSAASPASALVAGIRAPLPPVDPDAEPPDDIENLVQDLFIHQELIASGAIPQSIIWSNLAQTAGDRDLDAHGFTILFLLQASVGLPDTRLFSWGDPSERADAYNCLYRAYLRHSNLADVFQEVQELTYDHSEIPLFYKSELVQAALALVKHHQKFPDVDLLDSSK